VSLTSISILDSADVARLVGTRTVGASVHLQVQVPYQENRSDTFTVAANGTAVDVSEVPCNLFAIQVKGTTATPTAWSVVLEGSLNGTQYTTILTHTSTEHSDGATIWKLDGPPIKYFRSRLVSITLGSATNVIATIIGQAG
jgi:hypothetical protein